MLLVWCEYINEFGHIVIFESGSDVLALFDDDIIRHVRLKLMVFKLAVNSLCTPMYLCIYLIIRLQFVKNAVSISTCMALNWRDVCKYLLGRYLVGISHGPNQLLSQHLRGVPEMNHEAFVKTAHMELEPVTQLIYHIFNLLWRQIHWNNTASIRDIVGYNTLIHAIPHGLFRIFCPLY